MATISELRCDSSFIKQLHEYGMDAVRINTAHASLQGAAKIVHEVRTVSSRIPIILDTKGPEIRTTAVAGEIRITKGQYITFMAGDGMTSEECIFVNYPGFCEEVPIHAQILIDDGHLEFIVQEKQDGKLLCLAMNSGVLSGKKTVNTPHVLLRLPSITAKDCEFINFAIEQDIDFIAHSFVRHKEDVLAVQRLLDERNSKIKIIAKIENKSGVHNLDEILDHVFGVMIARGDMGVELPAEDVPLIQKQIITRCNSRARPVIIATHMLESMTHSPRPTRAEVSDVANGVFDGADALMLSGETAKGSFPFETVHTMAKIIKRVEGQLPNNPKLPVISTKNPVRSFLAKAAVIAAQDLQARAIIIPTLSGASARIVSSYRSRTVIYAKCFSPRVMRELRLCYGIFSDLATPTDNIDDLIATSLGKLVQERRLAEQDTIIILGVTPGSETGANFLEINTVHTCLERRNKSCHDIP